MLCMYVHIHTQSEKYNSFTDFSDEYLKLYKMLVMTYKIIGCIMI